MAIEYNESELRRLTPKQQEIAKLVAVGFSNQDIADELGLCKDSVKNTNRRIFDRLGVYNRVQRSVRLISR